MSTKSTIYLQASGDNEYEEYFHVFWECGIHQPEGIYIATNSDCIKITDPNKLADALNERLKVLNAPRS